MKTSLKLVLASLVLLASSSSAFSFGENSGGASTLTYSISRTDCPAFEVKAGQLLNVKVTRSEIALNHMEGGFIGVPLVRAVAGGRGRYIGNSISSSGQETELALAVSVHSDGYTLTDLGSNEEPCELETCSWSFGSFCE